MVDLIHLARLFAEAFGSAEGQTKLKVARFRPLAAVLNERVVRNLHAAGHEFYWSNEAQLLARKSEDWRLVIGRDAIGRSTIFMDRKEELVLLHRKKAG